MSNDITTILFFIFSGDYDPLLLFNIGLGVKQLRNSRKTTLHRGSKLVLKNVLRLYLCDKKNLPIHNLT